MGQKRGKISRLEKRVEETLGPEGRQRFFTGMGNPESDDLLVLEIEGIITEGLVKAGKIPKEYMIAFLDRLKDYCDQKTVKIWQQSTLMDFLDGKTKLGSVVYKESKPSRPLNYSLIAKVFDLERENG